MDGEESFNQLIHYDKVLGFLRKQRSRKGYQQEALNYRWVHKRREMAVRTMTDQPIKWLLESRITHS